MKQGKNTQMEQRNFNVPNEPLPAIAKLVPPQMDKHWSFQVVRVSKDMRNACVAEFKHPDVAKASPFLQGDSGDWLMVEFWHGGKEAAEVAAKQLAGALELVLMEGNFTRAELGL